jgi:transcriptional regulator with GAF, ATPase, and Fis domain
MIKRMGRADGPTEDERLALKRTVDFSTVLVSWADRAGRHTVTVTERTLLGSAEHAQVVVSDPTVSRVHAELTPRPDGLWIRDLRSRNGTFVGGVYVVEARVSSERQLRVGSVNLEIAPAARATAAPAWEGEAFGPLLGRSPIMRKLFATLGRVSPTDYSVLIRGETGTGKELVARAIHDASGRRSGPFVVVDCAAIPENLFESQLFGHTRGAFTGALQAHVGDVEAANGGTLFLDEIGELPASMQPKLLRMLESRTIRRIGETQPRPVDVRIVSATHRDLPAMVSEGAFREDLYFRLASVPVSVPPLRERIEDVELLAQRFLPRTGAGVLPADVATELGSRRWPGNVRELRNFIERAVALGVGEALALQHDGPARAMAPSAAEQHTDSRALPPNPFGLIALDQIYKDFREQWMDHGERVYLDALLATHGGNVALAAERAGLDRTHVYRLLRKHRR